MSERKITVSNGRNFFLISVSEFDEARAAGFYIPALRDRTIVSDGSWLWANNTCSIFTC